MNTVSPIRSMEDVRRVKQCAERMGQQQYLLILLGLNTGLRISDLLQITVGDMRDRGYIVRREQKTGKQTEIRIHPAVVASIVQMTATRASGELIFASRQAHRHGRPIDRSTAYRWVEEACRRAGIKGPIGCHTLRKTYGYHFYEQYHDIVTLMHHFNHSSESITLRYIGYTQQKVNEKTVKFRM